MLHISSTKYLKIFKLTYSKFYCSTATLAKPKYSSCKRYIFLPFLVIECSGGLGLSSVMSKLFPYLKKTTKKKTLLCRQ